jgi:hypothetical protein
MTRTDTSVPAARPRRRRLSRSISLAVALGATIAGSNLVAKEASAGVPPALQPTKNRPMQFLFGFGPSFGIGGSRWIYGDCGPGNSCNYYRYGFGGRYGGAFKLSQEFNWATSPATPPARPSASSSTRSSRAPTSASTSPRSSPTTSSRRRASALYISPSVSLGYHLDPLRRLLLGRRLRRQLPRRQPAVRRRPQADPRGPLASPSCRPPTSTSSSAPATTTNGYYGGGCAPGYGCGAYFRAKLDFMFGGGVAF